MAKITGPQKAARLLVALGTAIYASILECLNEAEIELLKKEVAKVPKLKPPERQAIFAEFLTEPAVKLALAMEQKKGEYGQNLALFIREKNLTTIMKIQRGDFFTY